MNEFVFKNQKKLRCGLTTGTCAAACAQAAMLRLLTGQVRSEVTVRLPESRKRVQVDVAAAKLHEEIADNRANRGTQQDSNGRSPLQQAGSAESDTRSSEQRMARRSGRIFRSVRGCRPARLRLRTGGCISQVVWASAG